MTASFDFGGLRIERYYHFHCISDHAFLQVLDELGLSDRMHWVETRMGYWYQDRLQAWGNPVALLRFKGLSLIAKFRYGLHAFLSTRRSDWRPLDALEATGWIRDEDRSAKAEVATELAETAKREHLARLHAV